MDATRQTMAPPVAHPDRPPADRVGEPLYRKPGICVTDRWFIVAGRRYPVRELSRLRTARGPYDPLIIRATVVAAVTLAVVGLALAVASEPSRFNPAVVAAAALAAALPLALALLGHRLRPRSFELWGEYQGLTVQLFFSDCERQYGQVTRALVRAREIAERGQVGRPWAAIDSWAPLSQR